MILLQRSATWRTPLFGLLSEHSIAELYGRKYIVQDLYCCWSKECLKIGKQRLARDTARAATPDEVKNVRREASVG